MDKVTTNSGIPVFGQVLNLLDKQEINKIATQTKANRYTKRFDAYQHLAVMLYAVFARLNSLREIELGFLSSATRMNHLGIDCMIRRSTLSDANARRSPEFFEKVYYALYERYRPLLADSRPVKGLKRKLFIMDSTTISLFSQIFRGTGRNAVNGQKKGGAKSHQVISADEDVMVFMNITDAADSDQFLLKGLYARLPKGSCITFDMGYVNYEAWQEFSDSGINYVTREKRRCRRNVLKVRDIPEEEKDEIISDEEVELSWRTHTKRPMTEEELSHRRGRRPKSGTVWVRESKSGRHKCRRITKWRDNRDEGTITFLTNDFETSAAVLCEVYRRRWQIETLFKRLKKNFPLKYFLGDNRNAIQIQIWVSMTAWLLTQVIMKRTKRKWSQSNLMATIRILLNSYYGMYEFLDLPEALWISLIKKRQEEEKTQPPMLPFSDMRGPVFENQRTISHLQALTTEN